MELSFPKCESIFDTLPVGYYAGRRIGMRLDDKAKTSFYSPIDDKIVISYPIIAKRMEAVAEGGDEEEAVRSMVYHEVAHSILTPDLSDDYLSDQINIFEDERIETILRDYFLNTNFRKQLFDIHGGHAPKATDAKSAFFNAVRFGLGTAEVQNKVIETLHKHEELNRTDGWWKISPYKTDIRRLWELVQEEFSDNPSAFQPPTPDGNDKGQGQGQGTPQQIDRLGESSNKKDGQSGSKKKDGEGEEEEKNGKGQGEDGEDTEDENGQGEGEGEEEQGEGEGEGNPGEGDADSDAQTIINGSPQYGKPHKSSLSPDDIKKLFQKTLSVAPNLSQAQIDKLADFQKRAEIIIGNFNKKNKGGSGINAYSGVFNPRAVMRDDYRYFERSMTTQGNNKFGTCHLNLLIDCSGSFGSNEGITNGILKVLTDIEKKNRNFSMDVSFINDDFRVCKTIDDRRLVAEGGNTIPSDMKEILLKMQKPQTCNYNIVLFDGDAFSDFYGDYPEKCKIFGAFDMKQTTLITDPQNDRYMNPKFNSSKVVVTQNYTQELIEHVIHALTIAFG